MIDRYSRTRAKIILKKLAIGKISNFECENQFLDLISKSSDPVIFALFRTVCELTGDNEEMVNNVFEKNTAMRRRLCRWLLFLQTDLEYKWPKLRRAPGLRDIYQDNWLECLLGKSFRMARANERLFNFGDYRVWPFLRDADFHAARSIKVKNT